jgi:hypothetical protein
LQQEDVYTSLSYESKLALALVPNINLIWGVKVSHSYTLFGEFRFSYIIEVSLGCYSVV